MSTAHATRPSGVNAANVVPIRRKQRGGTHNKGLTFPPDPPSVEEIVRIIRDGCRPDDTPYGALCSARLRALIMLMWRTGLRCAEALDLEERDLLRDQMAVIVRCGKGGKRRLAVMDEFGWRELDRWLEIRQRFPSGPIFCGIVGSAAGRRMWACDVRRQFREA